MAKDELERSAIFGCVQIAIVSFGQCRAELRKITQKAASLKVQALVGDKRHEVIRSGAYRSDLQNGATADQFCVAHEDCAREVCTPEDCAREVCTPEVCTPEDCVREVCTPEDCVREDCAHEDCAREGCAREVCTRSKCQLNSHAEADVLRISLNFSFENYGPTKPIFDLRQYLQLHPPFVNLLRI